jgi:hypothetical protein
VEPEVVRSVPGLEPQRINLEQYMALTPEKLELIEGYLIAPPDWRDERQDLLLLLLTNEGLEAAVRLAPAERWREAIRKVYGED